ncbi:MAG: DNA-directed DNA polymerase II small subunit [Methanobacterium sp.]|uniref:DNA-directed DNA polymerase II small subunit n=1 Tax=Methanobacterium sp. TaxID=2164 RepID=UPI003D64B6BB|nr:DNA-directed DNA polymerase II small subunit [Methanobacterium sp.]
MSDDIILKFSNANILINDKAYERIKNQENSHEFTESLIDELLYSKEDVFILTEEILNQYLNKDNLEDIKLDQSTSKDLTSSTDVILKVPQSKFPTGRPFDFHVIQDTSKKSYTSGELKDFTTYFKSRYQKLYELLDRRGELKDHRSISDIKKTDDVVKVIGIVNDIKNTKNNHKFIELEDETGSTTILVHNENHQLFEKAEKIVKDEIIGVVGSKKGTFVIASELVHPGVPRIDEKPMDFSTVFISDVHIGSSTFLGDAFNRFINWINGDFGDTKHQEIAQNVKYLVIAGDLVDGIGIYPHQEKELTIKDIYGQYDEAARLLGEIRTDIKIIISPGNHDAARLAEPQPAISQNYAKSLYELKNAEFVSNPGIVSLDGINVLIYHGRSFDDMAMSVKGFSHQQSDLIMKELLEKRHLAPIYGERTPLASEYEDHLVIKDVPDVFHTGHVHINAYKRHKGVHMINSGTFQSQTEFQKIYNIMPTCAEVPVIHKGQFKLLNFA